MSINYLNIIEGATKELLNMNKELSDLRMDVCKKCPLFVKTSKKCNDKLFLNPIDNEVTTYKTKKSYQGCGCYLKLKTRVVDEECPAKKW